MKRYGIRITLPSGDPLAASHLLGPEWVGHRWFETADERDQAYRQLQEEIGYYRKGDAPSQVLERVERGAGQAA